MDLEEIGPQNFEVLLLVWVEVIADGNDRLSGSVIPTSRTNLRKDHM